MKHLFSAEGELALSALTPSTSLLAFDYDGTLSPITPLPDHARTIEGITRSLTALNTLGKLAVVTGRSVSDLASRLAVKPAFLIGNHGIEGLPGLDVLSGQARQMCRSWLQQLKGPNGIEAQCPGIMVEDKALSLSIHFRLCKDRGLAKEAIEHRIAALSPAPRVIGGHCVLNLLHPHAPDKRVALENLIALAGCEEAIYVGDDESDEMVFRAARRGWLTVRVGYVPDTAARFFLHHQSEVGSLLVKLAAKLRLHAGPGAH